MKQRLAMMAAAVMVGSVLLAGCGKDEACSDAPGLAAALSAQFNTGVTAGSLQVVKSPDYANVWIAAVELGGAGNGAKAAFAVNALTSPSTVFAVDNVAKASSRWPDGSAQGLSPTSSGVETAKGCL